MDAYDQYIYDVLHPPKLVSTDPEVIANKLYKDWVKNHKNWRGPFDIDFTPEMEYAMMIVREDLKKGWDLVLACVEACKRYNDCVDKYKWLSYVGAGYLEDLFAEFGEEIYEDVIKEMQSNDLFLIVCTSVWPHNREDNDPLWIKFQSELEINLKKNTRAVKLIKKYLN
jgi:hypothetical protein